MSMRVMLAVGCVVLATSLACERSSSSGPMPSPGSNPLGPSTLNAVPAPDNQAISSTSAIKGRLDRLVTMMDACDPATFNAAVGPGTCIRSGGVTFRNFLALLTKHASVGAWRFAPSQTSVQEGHSFLAVNRGGEVHTFTEVAEFGGGIVPDLNTLSHNPVIAPECASLDEDDFVAPGATYKEEIEENGTVKFQCCIHPWMRLEARVSDR